MQAESAGTAMSSVSMAAGVSSHWQQSCSKALAASLDEAVRADDAYFNKLVRIMATR
jgi:hypothetical protein